MARNFFDIQATYTSIVGAFGRSLGILNTASIPLGVHEFCFAKQDSGFANLFFGIELHRSSGGTAGNTVTPTPHRAGAGEKATADSTGVSAWSGNPNLNAIFEFSFNPRKTFLWQAKRGKEFRSYGAEGFHFRGITGNGVGSVDLAISMVFEE